MKRASKRKPAVHEGSGGAAVNPNHWRIHGKAYDLTEWLPQHPGGRYLLDITRGTDCTELFESYHAPSLKEAYIRTTLDKYAAEDGKGDDEPAATTYNWESTPVYDDMKRVVRGYRQRHGIKATDSWAAVAWIALWASIHYASLYWWLTGVGFGSDRPLLNAAVLGLSIWQYSTPMVHDGTHYALCHSARASEWLGWTGGWGFCLPSTWIRQHVTGHHVHTNTPEKDPDLYHYRNFMVVHPSDSHAPPMPWARPLAPLFTQWVPSLVGTVRLLRRNKWDNMRDEYHAVWAGGERRALAALWLLVVGSIAAVARRAGPATTALPFLVVSMLYYAFSQVSHINAASFEPPPPPSTTTTASKVGALGVKGTPSSSGQGRCSSPCECRHEWAMHQIQTTQGDYSYGSAFWNKVSVGLHNQALHHCFPSVHPCHYPALSALMAPVFARHGVKMNGLEQSYGDALEGHLRHLRALNAPHGA